MDLGDQIWAEKCFIWKVAFFLKNQLGIGVWWGKPGEMGQNWILEPLFSEMWVIMLHITNFTLPCTRSLDGRVVIAFRSNSPWFCEIWAVMGSIPCSGTWFFFRSNKLFNVFMYAYISDNDKQESKVLGSLLKITINFWTVCLIESVLLRRKYVNKGCNLLTVLLSIPFNKLNWLLLPVLLALSHIRRFVEICKLLAKLSTPTPQISNKK